MSLLKSFSEYFSQDTTKQRRGMQTAISEFLGVQIIFSEERKVNFREEEEAAYIENQISVHMVMTVENEQTLLLNLKSNGSICSKQQ